MSVPGSVYYIKKKRDIAFNGNIHFEPVLQHFYDNLYTCNLFIPQ